jgi:predicted small lipoprotein YifL
VALALLLALAAGCGAAGPKSVLPPIDGAADGRDSSSDGPSDAAAVVVGHCCVLQVTGAGPAGASCGELQDATLGITEPCLTANSAGTYGRWTCGAGAEAPVCGNNGLSCGVGDPCTLVDVGCPGVVQTCNFKPYTPPPG